MVHYRLYYFDARYLGEPARLLFKYANVPFEDDRVDKIHWQDIKKTLPYGQVPILYVDGQCLAQSYAIFRYLGRKFGLAGKDDFESAKIDEIADFHKDAINTLAQYLHRKLGYLLGNADDHKQAFLENAERLFPTYVKILHEFGSGFLSKGGLSWVDFLVAEYLLSIKQNEPEVFEKYPELEEYVKRVHSLSQIKEYVANRKFLLY